LNTNVPSPAFTTPFVDKIVPLTTNVLLPIVVRSNATAPLVICGTLNVDVPANVKIPPEFTVNFVLSGVPDNTPKVPPLTNVKLLSAVLPTMF
jgi:hypothetical protein